MPLIPPPVIAIATGAAMWGTTEVSGLAVALPAQTALAIAVAGLGLALDLTSVSDFFRRGTTINPLAPDKTNVLVTEGFYRYSRNPMYLGLALILAGWALWLGDPINALWVAVFVLAITRLQILPEEQALEARFGDDFRAYKARVRRWI